MHLTVEAVAATRAQLWDSGFRPIAICNWDDPNVEAGSRGKRPLQSGWHLQALLDPPRAAVTLPTLDQLNTGVLADGLRAFDLDIDDAELAGQVRALIFAMLGFAPARYREGSGRCLILYRASLGEPEKVVLAGKLGKVEVLGHGQQFVAFGRHLTGSDLYWYPDAPGVETLDGLPIVTEAQVRAVLAAIAPLLGVDGPREPREPRRAIGGEDDGPKGEAKGEEELRADDPLLLISALQAILNDPTAPADWEAWNATGMALWAATGGSDLGRGAWHTWSSRHPAYDPARCDERWGHYFRSPPSSIGAGTLYHRAEAAGWHRPVEPIVPLFPRPPPGPRAQAVEFPASPINWDMMTAVPPRQWVYGHFLIRRFVSVLGAPGGTGKTAYAFAVACCLITGRELLKEAVHEAGNIWVYNLEDPKDELLRRLHAAVRHHGISRTEVEGRLFLDSGRDRPLHIATLDPKGNVIASPIADPIIATIKANNIRVMIVDPFVRSHALIENANEQIDFAIAQWARIADEADCAILLVHHFRKGGQSGDAAAFRGASSLIDAARAAISLAPMTAEDADRLGIPDHTRWQFIRADNAKLNLAPPPEHTTWLRLVSVPLDNAHAGRSGDQVQTVERWEPESPWEGIPMSTVVRILERISTGPGDGEQFTIKATSADKSRWAGSQIVLLADKSEGQARGIIRAWVESGLLVDGKYHSPGRRKEVAGCSVDQARLSEMRQTISETPFSGVD